MVAVDTAAVAETTAAPVAPRFVRVSGGWFGDLHLAVGQPIEEIEVPDYVDTDNYELAQKILVDLNAINAQLPPGDDKQELEIFIDDLQDEIWAYEFEVEEAARG